MIYPLAIAAVAAAEGTLLARRHLLPWWKRRRKIVEQCEVCGKGLTRRQVRELRSAADDDAEALAEIGGTHGGGTYMAATYCRKHFPSGVASQRVES